MDMALSTAKRVLFIVAIVSCVAMLIMIGEYYRGTGAVVAGQQQITNSVGILLWMGQYIGNQIPALTEYHLSCLGAYTIQTQEGRTRARQSLNFAGPGFNGGMLTFKRASDTDVTSDFLMFATDQPLFEYTLVFDSGLQSKIDEKGNLEDLQEESIQLMGTQFNILDAKINTGSNTVILKMMGAGGLVKLTDNYADTSFNQGVEVNGRSVSAQVQIIGSETGMGAFGIYSIKYRPYALHEVDVPPRHGIKGTMDEPEKLLNPQFNIFYTGLRSGGPAVPAPRRTNAGGPGVIQFRPVSDDQYKIDFTTKEGGYSLPLVTLRGGLSWGDVDRTFIFKENDEIGANDYFMVSTGTSINDRTNILVYELINFDNGVVYIKDWNGGNKRAINFDASGAGSFLAAGHDYKLQVNMADPTHPIRVDLNGDGSIGATTVQAVLVDGTRLKFSGAGNIDYIVPKRLFEDRSSDETASMQIAPSGGDLSLTVSSPSLISSESGIREGMMEYGTRFVYDKSRTPQKLTLYSPGGQAMGAVSIGGGLGFSTGTGQSQAGILVTCEENVLQQKQAQQQAIG